MRITDEIKSRIAAAIVADRENYPSDNKHAVSLGISASVYNSIKKGTWERQVSDASWVGMARRLGVTLRQEQAWNAAETPTWVFITEQLALCQESGLSAILCDIPNIGKSFTARAYTKSHRNAIVRRKRQNVMTLANVKILLLGFSGVPRGATVTLWAWAAWAS